MRESAPGSELEIFEKAVRWKRYFASHMATHIRGDVLEAGAGIGANLKAFAHLNFRCWTCLEPDCHRAERLRSSLPSQDRYETILGTLRDLPGRRFDAILCIDVLEHIEDDHAELRLAATHLNPGGTLIVLAPAHSWLFTSFDAAIGHFRRYSKGSLAAAAPAGLSREKLFYLDAAGLVASAANRLILKRAMPTELQIRAWDRLMVPLSRLIDPLLGYQVGKSVLGVWVAR
jgi:SAM-dependent methyltransferase